jgi:crotonobetainyl-CoA:carnitine CoA-transferase CaiB-like acyl-CoA transferase
MSRPVAGCRVLELGGYVAAPFASLILANLGADVIKVESLRGDPTRARKSNFIAMNSGKRSIALDLKDDRARDIWNALLQTSDVIVQNLDSAATDALKIGYADCRSVNPDIVYCHVKAFGSGAYQDRPATNPIVEALAGVMSITWANGKPTRQASPFYDQLAGAFAALGIVSALSLDTRVDGQGFVEVDLFETGLFSAAPRIADYFVSGELNGEVWGTSPYDTFETRDGRWIFLGVVNDGFWRSFCHVMGLTGPGEDPRFATTQGRLALKDEVDRLAGEAVAQLTLDEVLEKLQAVGVPCAPVNDFRHVVENEHVVSDGKLFESTYEGSDLKLPGFPVEASFISDRARRSPPGLGEHSSEVLRSLGYSDQEVVELASDSVVAGPTS